MEAAIKEKEKATIKEEKKGRRRWISRILNFLMYEGWLLVVVFSLELLSLSPF